MHSPWFFLAACGLSLSAPLALAASYTQETTTIDLGGGAAASAKYSLRSSLGAGGAAASSNYRARSGFIGQLSEPQSLLLAAPAGLSLPEGGTRQLSASLVLDDGTRQTLLPEAVQWQESSPYLTSVSAAGLVSAGIVYQNTPASVQGDYLGLSYALGLTVANVAQDDFAPYVGDGLPDYWQVAYFGSDNASAANAGLSGDGDGDSLTNLQEYAFGMNPLVNSSATVDWLGSSLLARGTPRVFMSTAPGSFTYRAVFARRIDFAAARLKYTVEFSANLSFWQASTATPAVLANDGEIQVVSVPYPFAVGNRKATYFRVRVEQLP